MVSCWSFDVIDVFPRLHHQSYVVFEWFWLVWRLNPIETRPVVAVKTLKKNTRVFEIPERVLIFDLQQDFLERCWQANHVGLWWSVNPFNSSVQTTGSKVRMQETWQLSSSLPDSVDSADAIWCNKFLGENNKKKNEASNRAFPWTIASESPTSPFPHVVTRSSARRIDNSGPWTIHKGRSSPSRVDQDLKCFNEQLQRSTSN